MKKSKGNKIIFTKKSIIDSNLTLYKLGKIAKKKFSIKNGWYSFVYVFFWCAFIPGASTLIVNIFLEYVLNIDLGNNIIFFTMYLPLICIIFIYFVQPMGFNPKWWKWFSLLKLWSFWEFELNYKFNSKKLKHLIINVKNFNNIWRLLYKIDYISKKEFENEIIYKKIDDSYYINLNDEVTFRSWKDVFSLKNPIFLWRRNTIYMFSKNGRKHLYSYEIRTIDLRKKIIENELQVKIDYKNI